MKGLNVDKFCTGFTLGRGAGIFVNPITHFVNTITYFAVYGDPLKVKYMEIFHADFSYLSIY